MTEKLYFYTDPLAAAWMAKHHGLKILGPVIKDGGARGTSNRAMPVWILARCIEAAEKGFSASEDRYFIHSDSLPLLEPREGDLLTGRNRSVFMFYDAKVSPSGTPRVAERKGIPFIWPEGEEA